MDTSQHTHSLSAEQLEAFLQNKLPAEETKRVQSLLDDCELSREALEGYTLVPGAFADVDGLKKNIAAKSGMSSLVNLNSILVAGVIVGVGLAVYLWPSDNKSEVADNVKQPDVNMQLTLTPQANSLSPAEDHFVNPEARVVAVTLPKAKPGRGDTQMVMNYESRVIEPIPVDDKEQPIVETKPVVPVKVEAGYNAQVGFIADLKVTEFDKYYATPIEVKEVPLTGVPAKYEDDNGMTVDYEQEETVRLVPADQFLREGLIAFRDGRYGKCVSKMEVLLEHNPNDINALFYTAVSYVRLEMYSKAVPLLDKIILDENNVFDEEAEWYKAVALEGNGDAGAAKELFQKIAGAGGFYADQAKKHLR
ncbi:MAG TPA: hypothetical protein VK826_03000 [Bacteroidia bacterium]|nr:hypothetical protein [Bacteroidia bacterium]